MTTSGTGAGPSKPEKSDNDNEENSTNSNIDAESSIPDNPYAILNIDANATVDEIQKSYKFLSRSFHPDKQPPGAHRDDAQQYFIKLKASYDILIDPVLRLAYDDHGIDGVTLVKKSTKIYESIGALLEKAKYVDPNQYQNENSQNNQAHTQMYAQNRDDAKLTSQYRKQAREILSDALQYYNFHNLTRFHKPTTNAEIKIKCNSTHSSFLGEGYESQSSPLEVEESRFSVSVSSTPSSDKSSKTSLSFGGNGSVTGGKGSSNAQFSVKHEPVQGTDVNLDLDIGTAKNETKVTLGTTRVTNNRSYVASSLTTSTSGKDMGVSFTSHRSLLQDKYQGTWVMGFALSKFQLQYGLLSLTKNAASWENMKCTLKLNMGMNYTPIQLIAEKSFDEDHKHTGKLSWGWGQRGIDLKVITSRYLSKYCKVSVGLNHVSSMGLTWLFQLQQGTIQFTVPVFITTVLSPAYALKSMYMTLFLGLVDASLGDLVLTEVNEMIGAGKDKLDQNKVLRREEMLLEREKIKRDALQQIRLMERPAEVKRAREEKKKGLVILSAVYEVLGGDSIDVTIALMFWVANSSLHLPSTTKSSMLGFHDVRQETPVNIESGYLNACWKVLEKFWNSRKREDGINASTMADVSANVPMLTVRYRYNDKTYEITVQDDEALSLPNQDALLLGGSRVT